MIVDTTYGASVDRALAQRTEALAAAGGLGDADAFVERLGPAREALKRLREAVAASPGQLRTALGPALWLLARDAPALPVNLNTAELEHLAALPGMDAAAAQRAVDSRRRDGAFADLDDFARRAGLDDAGRARLAQQAQAMRVLGTYRRR